MLCEVLRMESYEPEGREPEIIVINTEHEHVRILGGNLRERDLAIAAKIGIPAHRALWRTYRQSVHCKTVFVNGMIVAIFGVTGNMLGRKGKPWFMASPFVDGYPMKLVFRYRSEVRNMLKYFPVLEDWVHIEDQKTIRLLDILGFKFEKPKSLGNSSLMFVKATLER